MVTQQELRALIESARDKGFQIRTNEDADGWIIGVAGMNPGRLSVGNQHFVPPVTAAERLRAILHGNESQS